MTTLLVTYPSKSSLHRSHRFVEGKDILFNMGLLRKATSFILFLMHYAKESKLQIVTIHHTTIYRETRTIYIINTFEEFSHAIQWFLIPLPSYFHHESPYVSTLHIYIEEE